jgi:membrane fusion protein, heavy metal efflux system
MQLKILKPTSKRPRKLWRLWGWTKRIPRPSCRYIPLFRGSSSNRALLRPLPPGRRFAGSATAFTVADLSSVWVICDVYENDIPKIALGQEARIRLNAYPDHDLIGRVSDVGPVLDPSIRTAKVRIEVPNPGTLKMGMFVTATVESKQSQHFAEVPASSVLHLHDRDWVFVPAGGNRFRRVAVDAGRMNGAKQVILAGVRAGQQVVSNVLQLEATLEAQ